MNSAGHRASGVIREVLRTPVSAPPSMVRFSLADGRTLTASALLSLSDDRRVGELREAHVVDQVNVVHVSTEVYTGDEIYNLVVDGESGIYWANGITVRGGAQ